MPEILDVLTTDFIPGEYGQAVDTDYGTFLADNTVAEVQTDQAGIRRRSFALTLGGGGPWRFQPSDNLLILSVVVNLGYQYGLSRGLCELSFVYGNDNGFDVVQQIGSNGGQMLLPLVSAEVALGVWVPYRRFPGGVDRMSLGCTWSCWVSQINGPAILNGVLLRPSVSIKVLHSLAMI